ncbi:MAG TPA: type IV pilus twitching motility protein PilT [Blastocatellia bacterium]|nr:type IV pilus twitching motility protein PilT [Blastocatellia bacterium]
MVESVDTMLGILHNQKGQELRVAVGQPVQMVTPAGPYDLSPTPLTQMEFGSLIGPVVPEAARRLLQTQPETEFTYECRGVGPFRALIKRGAGGFTAVFRPAGTASRPLPQNPPVSPLPRQESGMQAPPPRVAPPEPPREVAPALQPVHQTAARASNGLSMDGLFLAMHQAKASDLHLSVSMPPMVRKDGQMVALDPSHPVITPEEAKRLLYSIMPEKNREEFERRHDTDFAYELDVARFRCNIFMDRKGMGGVFRIIPTNILTAEQLGLSPHILKLCMLSKGLVLVPGPTGSGKSTTLCALVDYINRNRADHIITIEDPIEFVHENKKCLINQREVHNHTDTFKDALRAALREDPDIVLVGEMRDLETVAIAIETAETGHLVFGTLHTSTAASTVDRIIDQFPPDRQTQIRIMLSESLKGVISQTLLRKKGGGRVAALEVLIVTPAISNLIREGKTFQIPSSMQTGRGIGMVTLNDALIELVKSNTVEAEEAYLKAIDKTGFEALLKRNNIDTKFLQASHS